MAGYRWQVEAPQLRANRSIPPQFAGQFSRYGYKWNVETNQNSSFPAATSSTGLAVGPEIKTINEQALPAQWFAGWRSLARWLVIPWVDKTLALLLVAVTVYPIAMHFRRYMFLGEALFLSDTFLFIVPMVFRRAPARVSVNPFHWLLAFLASYWGLVILSIEKPGRLLVSWKILFPIYLCGAFILIWGRLSLGRNIGIVPAQRKIVERGAYRWMRHPIYTSVFFVLVGRTLESYTLLNLLLYSLGALLFVARTLAEEKFLRTDPSYSAYMRRVRWRWVPGLI